MNAFVNSYKELLGTSKGVKVVHLPTVQKGRVVSGEQGVDLIKEVTAQEIHEALKAIPANKAPGPDGYTSQFFKDAKDIIGKDVVAAVQEFFVSGKLLKQVNTTNLTLIPKKARPETVVDFRPIACCNVVYKVISKVICNGIAAVLPSIISETQSAFVKGRDNVDNILICHDLVRIYKRKSCSPRCIMKVDLKKAYDSVEGLDMNNEKSKIYFNGMAPAEVDYILHLSGFKVGVFPFRYLSIPISYMRMAVGDCTRLVEKVVGRIRGWGAKKLSYAGKLVLIRAVLTQLHSFWTRVFVIPLTVIDRIEGICRNYLWSGSDQYLKTLDVSWEKICNEKRYGGLNIVNARLWNQAVIGKYTWWLAAKSDHMWIRWVDHWIDNKGIYSVSSGYKWLCGQQSKISWCPLIWNKTIIPKHSFIGWLVVQERLMTRERLLKFGIIADGSCFFCQTHLETHQHLLYDSKFSQLCWDLLRGWLEIDLPSTGLIEWCLKWRCKYLMKKQIVYAAIVAVWYHLWHARNVCRLEAMLITPSALIMKVKQDICRRCKDRVWSLKIHKLPWEPKYD
ncbi:uncharacterized protein LOC141586672 [Silene latifolia]|uniref:uncharacterized protein LOC141586672 n=1 Tax=Silene latifolia TaxID=37657 RepID=UPI003D77423A